jgi:hypothetical protein
MSTGIDIQFVRENYQRMTDAELIRIATQDAAGLTSEAQQVVKEEIEYRKLDKNIFEAVKAQNKTYTLEEIDNYCDIIRNSPCPSCGTTFSKLNGTLTSEVMSFIFFTHWSKKIKVGCPDCLDKANNNALIKSILIGWWGIPWGFIRTPIAIGQNLKSKRTNHLDSPNDYLRSYTLSKIGQLETYKNNKEALQQIISSE